MTESICFERATDVSDNAGGSARVWRHVPRNARVFAKVTPKAGRESLDATRQAATFVFVFEVYNREDITELDRIIWNGEAYNIRGVLRAGSRPLTLKIEAERGVAS